MLINVRKALFLLTLVASSSIALNPIRAAAQTTLPTVTVIGHRPQSREAIERFLDQAREASLRTEILEFVGILDEPSYPQGSLSLYTVPCRLPQDARTNAVTQALSGPRSLVYPDGSPYLAFGTEMTVHYMNRGTERFVVTGGGGRPDGEPVRALTPVAGSLVCPP
jgi:hypothetical protein